MTSRRDGRERVFPPPLFSFRLLHVRRGESPIFIWFFLRDTVATFERQTIFLPLEFPFVPLVFPFSPSPSPGSSFFNA